MAPRLMPQTRYAMTADQYVERLTKERDEARLWVEHWRSEYTRLQYQSGLALGEAVGLRQAVEALKLAVASLRERVQELEGQQVEVATKTAAVVPALAIGNGQR